MANRRREALASYVTEEQSAPGSQPTSVSGAARSSCVALALAMTVYVRV